MLSVASTRTEPKSSAIITAPGEKCGLGRRRRDDARALLGLFAHVNNDRVEPAYRRTDLFEKGRSLMASWAAYVGSSGL